MKVVTFNIRGDFGVDGKNDFCYRKPLILKKLTEEQPDIIGFQEVLPHVAAWIQNELKGYCVVGCGREKNLAGEQMTVAFRRDAFNLIEMRTFWLSPTPFVPGSRYENQSWCPRTATELVLMEHASGKAFRVVNTHLDHEGSDARRRGLQQILQHLECTEFFPEAPVVLMGDFNASPGSEELKVFNDYAGYKNAAADIGVTFHGFMLAANAEQIDYIFLKGRVEPIRVWKWTDEQTGVYLSDHYPVCVEFEFFDESV